MATTNTERSPVDFIIYGLKKAARELEELQVEIALGKMPVQEIFENLKSDLNTRVRHLKLKVSQAKTKDLFPLSNALEHLKLQTTLGLAETREAFEEQREQIEEGMNTLENKLKNSIPGLQVAKIQLEIEKFKAKLHLLSLSYQSKKINLEYDLKQKRNEFDQLLDKIQIRMLPKEERNSNNWRHFTDEIKDAFSHLRSAY